jgi:hypothetical protein
MSVAGELSRTAINKWQARAEVWAGEREYTKISIRWVVFAKASPKQMIFSARMLESAVVGRPRGFRRYLCHEVD